ncbi:GntR family transcriptional regulator [Amorphus orientalis]|uniref:DNA-binding GntR family transcriptional regulator n=1 Tax=Amorphus orientalis TaxID=649198 RepID=A0AAE3VRM8_9HYPH|nr:GntR family transcriptional regulator [Amorphus orientalis]MDQ0316883.1 DNA-binding GntR family transcriptional regulator [Amorphus orientalis]
MADTTSTTGGTAGPEGPRYARIRKILEDRLKDGFYPVGSLMPTEIELAAEFDTSRFTIREALRHLTEHGYVERRQGVGTRVISTRPVSSFYQSYGSLEELFQVAVDTWYVILGTTLEPLTAEVAERVGGLAGEEWYRVDGMRWTEPGGKPICYIQSYVPARFSEVVPSFAQHQGPLFSLLESHAEGPIEEAVQEIRATEMPPEIGRLLGLRPGSWSLQILRRYVTEAGVLIASFNWHPADQMTYVMHIQRSRQGDQSGNGRS